MPFHFRPGRREAPSVPQRDDGPTHRVTSDFSTGLCRFTLECTCGIHHDTPFIDEALEWRELHESLAPLADRMVG